MNSFPVYDSLRYGKENAISGTELCKLLGYHDIRTLRRQIALERINGALILTNRQRGGYYRSNNLEEIREFERTTRAQALSLLLTARAARRIGRNINGQLSIDSPTEDRTA